MADRQSALGHEQSKLGTQQSELGDKSQAMARDVAVKLGALLTEAIQEGTAHFAHVRKPGETKKAVADADFLPKPEVVKTGTGGD